MILFRTEPMKRWLPPVLLTLVVAIGCASSVVHLSTLPAMRPDQLPFRLFEYGLHGGAFLAGALSLLMVWRRRLGAGARALALMLGLLCILIGVVMVTPDRGPAWYQQLRNSATLQLLLTPLLVSIPGFLAAAFARFSVLFPRELQIEDVERAAHSRGTKGSLRFLEQITEYMAMGPLQRKLRQAEKSSRFFSSDRQKTEPALLLFRSGRVWILGVIPALLTLLLRPLPPSIWSSASTMILAVVYAGVLLLLTSGIGMTFIIANFKAATQDERRKMLWIVEGIAASIWIAYFGGFVELVGSATGLFQFEEWGLLCVPAALLAFIAGTAFAVFFRGAIDPGLVIRRTTLYGIVASLAIFAFAGIENLVADVLATRLGFSPKLGSWIAGGTIALGFNPVRLAVVRRLAARSAREQPEPGTAYGIHGTNHPDAGD